MVALQARSDRSSGPRELFSISQVEKAFGAAYTAPGSEGCVRAWGERYLTGLKEPEFTYEEALALPERTQDEKKERSSYIAKSFGKALEGRADEWFETGTASFADEPGKRLFPGLHLLPHPTQLDVLPDGRRGYHKQVPVSTKLIALASPEAISFQGFKDAIFQVNGARFLVDYKTTKPKVDNRKNAELGKPAGWWTWMKTPEQLLGDYQWNLYEWDEFSKHGQFIPSRWVYFASQETPQARAVDVQVKDIDVDRVKSICTQLADRANELRRHIRNWRGYRASGQERTYTESLPKNISNCNAFGRLCPYHVRSPGGTCAGGDDQVVPVGQLLTSPNSRPIRAVEVPVFDPQSHTYTFHSTEPGANTDMSIRDQINQQLQQQGQAPQGMPPQAPPGYGPPPAAAPQQFVPQGQAPQGAPPQAWPQANPMTQAAPFQPAPGQPGFAGAGGPQPHVGPPEYQQAFQPAPAPAPVVQQAPAAAYVPQTQQQPPAAAPSAETWYKGKPNPMDPNWVYNGQGSWMPLTEFQAEQAAQAPAPTPVQTIQTSPLPAVAQASVPTSTQALAADLPAATDAPASEPEDTVNEADLAALGALFITLVQSAMGMLKGETPAGEAPKKRGRKPKASA
jgi:hypothetical protein